MLYLVAALIGGLIGIGLLYLIGKFVDEGNRWDENE